MIRLEEKITNRRNLMMKYDFETFGHDYTGRQGATHRCRNNNQA